MKGENQRNERYTLIENKEKTNMVIYRQWFNTQLG